MITLSYPYASPSSTVTLRSPVLQDSGLREMPIRIFRTMGGRIYSYRVAPRTDRLIMRFEALKQADKDNLLTWLKGCYVTNEVKLLDWLGRTWRGNIITDPVEFTHVSSCNFTTTLEYTGTLQ